MIPIKPLILSSTIMSHIISQGVEPSFEKKIDSGKGGYMNDVKECTR